MEPSSFDRYKQLYFVAAILAGCAGSQTAPSGPLQLPDAVDPGYKVSAGLLYVALGNVDPPYDQVNVYDTRQKNPSPLAVITHGVSSPQSACTDSDGTLYVTNQGSGAGWISEYPVGKTKPSATITNGMSGPGFCAIDGDGNLWVTNVYTPDVVEYEKGSTSPYTTITKGIIYPIGIAIDHFGNLYVANHDGPYGGANVVVYSPKRKSPTRTISDGVEWPGGIGVDAKATLFVANYIPGNIEMYRAGQNHPYREITKEMNGPVAVTFAKSGWMYVTNVGAQSGGSGPANVILEFPPGSMTPSKKEISEDMRDELGTAYYPPLLP
jgi:sugar lactone lactonase YvrE